MQMNQWLSLCLVLVSVVVASESGAQTATCSKSGITTTASCYPFLQPTTPEVPQTYTDGCPLIQGSYYYRKYVCAPAPADHYEVKSCIGGPASHPPTASTYRLKVVLAKDTKCAAGCNVNTGCLPTPTPSPTPSPTPKPSVTPRPSVAPTPANLGGVDGTCCKRNPAIPNNTVQCSNYEAVTWQAIQSSGLSFAEALRKTCNTQFSPTLQPCVWNTSNPQCKPKLVPNRDPKKR